jgi:prevent-host-death family protein
MTVKAKFRQVSAGELKANCLALLDEVHRTRRTVVVTKRGRPVAQVVPIPALESHSLKGSLLFEEDLVAPIGVTWDAPLRRGSNSRVVEHRRSVR